LRTEKNKIEILTIRETRKHIKGLLLLFGLLLFNNYSVSAQYLYDIGFGGGISGYTGEISRNPFFRSDYTYGGFYRSNLSSRFAVTFGAEYGKVKGDTDDVDATYPAAQGLCDFDFSTRIISAEVLMEVNFFPYPFQTTVRSSSDMTPFYFVGVGMVDYKPLSGPGLLKEDKGEGNSIAIPMGVGLRWSVGKQWGMQLKFKASKLFVDDIDSYLLDDPFIFGDGGTHRMDWVYSTTFMITFSFGEDKWDCNCPERFTTRN